MVGEADGRPDEVGCEETVGPTVGAFDDVGLDDMLGCTETVGDMDGRPDEDGFDDRLGDTLGRTDVVGLYDNGACVVGVDKLGVDQLWDTLGCTLLSTFNDVDSFPDFDDLPDFDVVLLDFDAFPDLDTRESSDARLTSQWDRVRLVLPDWRIGLDRGDGEILNCSSEGVLPPIDLSWKIPTPRLSHIITGDVIAINMTASNRRRSVASLSDLCDVSIIRRCVSFKDQYVCPGVCCDWKET